MFLCGWLLLFTSLSAHDWSDEQVLALYRARWQVELVIKGLTQLLPLAQLRSQSTSTNEATLLALLLAAVLPQGQAAHLRQGLSQALSQWALEHAVAGEGSQACEANQPTLSSWTVSALSVQTLRQVVQGYCSFGCLRRYLCHRHRKRRHQESTIRSQLLAHLRPPAPDASLLFFCSSA